MVIRAFDDWLQIRDRQPFESFVKAQVATKLPGVELPDSVFVDVDDNRREYAQSVGSSTRCCISSQG